MLNRPHCVRSASFVYFSLKLDKWLVSQRLISPYPPAEFDIFSPAACLLVTVVVLKAVVESCAFLLENNTELKARDCSQPPHSLNMFRRLAARLSVTERRVGKDITPTVVLSCFTKGWQAACSKPPSESVLTWAVRTCTTKGSWSHFSHWQVSVTFLMMPAHEKRLTLCSQLALLLFSLVFFVSSGSRFCRI